MTDTTNPTAKYSKNYSGDVGETPKSMAGTWHLEAPDGRRWAGSCPINCVAQELAERVPVQVQLARVLAIADEPDLGERHAKLGVEYGTGKVDDLVDKLHAEITELRAKLEALEKQRPCGYLPYGYVGRSAMVFGQPVPESVPIYLAAGARPVKPTPAGEYPAGAGRLNMDAQIKEALTRAREVLRGLSFKDVAITSALEAIARTLDTERAPNGQAPAQPAPAAQADAKDAARWRYAVAIGENQAMNWLNVYNDWEGEGSFVDAIDAAREANMKEPT